MNKFLNPYDPWETWIPKWPLTIIFIDHTGQVDPSQVRGWNVENNDGSYPGQGERKGPLMDTCFKRLN